ncbi:MAG: glycosyltransferase [Paludibacteraceae bacterium]|nr:glycosyltransferase [Paludibacteraceae bacterium]
MKNGKVSIIIPCYKASDTISETLESVLAQTYVNWEAIVIDDCSPDNTIEIVSHYCKKDSRIRLIKLPENSGTATIPRNKGIEEAMGEYIAFIDADDVWMPEKLQTQIDLMEKKNCAFVFADYYKISSKQDSINTSRLVKAPLTVDYNILLGGNVIGCLTAMYSADILGKRYFRNCGHEDYLLWLSILKEGYKAYNTGKPLAFYRVGAKSLSSNKFKTIGWTWHILHKEEKLPLIKAVRYFCLYAVRGLVKFNK